MAKAKKNNYALPQARALEWYLKEGRGFYIKEDVKNFITYLSPDGIVLYGIPTEYFLLDKDRCRNLSLGTKLEKGSEEVRPGDIRDDGFRKVRIFNFERGATLLINEKYYMEFQKVYGEYFQNNQVSFYAQGPNAPLMFVKDKVVLGFILPIRH